VVKTYAFQFKPTYPLSEDRSCPLKLNPLAQIGKNNSKCKVYIWDVHLGGIRNPKAHMRKLHERATRVPYENSKASGGFWGLGVSSGGSGGSGVRGLCHAWGTLPLSSSPPAFAPRAAACRTPIGSAANQTNCEFGSDRLKSGGDDWNCLQQVGMINRNVVVIVGI